MSINKDFINYVRAGYPLLVIKSFEEFRVLEQYVQELTETPIKNNTGKVIGHYKALSWDCVDGVRTMELDEEKDFIIGAEALKLGDNPTEMNPMAPLDYLDQEAEEGTVMFLKDYHPFLKPEFEHATLITRKIRNLANKFKAQRKCLVLLSSALKVPAELEKEVAVIDFSLPDKDTLKTVLEQIVGPNKALMPKENNLDAVLDAAAGMTVNEAENAFSVSLTSARRIDASIIRKEKAQVVKKSGMLEIIEATETLDDIGGLENLKEYIITRKNCFTPEAKAFGVKPVKGILLLGVPGCGKSLTAKATASGLQRPLVRLDMGKIFGSYVGESENNMAECLKILGGISPAILWIDEIEKGLSGNKSGQEGHETTRRVFQMLLTWMQEKKEDVLLFATANSIDTLPPELLRAGRIDATFFVDLPDEDQRKEIFKIHLKKVGRQPSMFDEQLPQLMELCKNFTGAEIEVWISEAVTRAFSLGHSDIQLDDLQEAIKEVTPIYRLQATEIEASRQKAAARGTKNASRVRAPVAAQAAPARRVDIDTTNN